MPHVLTFDLGTTYLKAAVYDAVGRQVASARARNPVRHPQPDRAEVNPRDLLDALASLVRDLRAAADAAVNDVAALSYATQTNSFILLDEHDRPLTPIVLWTDLRATGCDREL